MAWNRRRPAFTLVELLVVIAIIGLLVALLLPAVFVVMTKAEQAKTTAEIANITRGIEAYKEKYGDYPPDFNDILPSTYTPAEQLASWQRSVAYRHIRKVWSNVDPTELNVIGRAAMQGRFNHANVILFWLGGLSDDSKFPFTGPGGPLSPGANSARGALFTVSPRQVELDNQVDIGPSGSPVYVNLQRYHPASARATAPYAYFDARTYVAIVPTASNPALLYANYTEPSTGGVIRPCKSTEVNGAFNAAVDPPDMTLYYVNRTSFQLFAPGRDRTYGADGGTYTATFRSNSVNVPVLQIHPTFKLLQSGGVTAPAAVLKGREDNLAVFAEGRKLEDWR